MGRLVRLPDRFAKPPSRIAQAPKRARPFYQSPEWLALIAAVIGERGKRCEDCGASGVRVFGDHVVELRDGGAPLDPGNVRLLCGGCHTRKTVSERRRRLGLAGQGGGRKSGKQSPA